MEAKTVKIGNEYYREGVKVAAPVKKKVIPKTPQGLAGTTPKKTQSSEDRLMSTMNGLVKQRKNVAKRFSFR